MIHLIKLLFIILATNITTAFADNCKVNDTTTGHWVSMPEFNSCNFPGAHDQDSYWPIYPESSMYGSPHRTEGAFKQTSTISSTGWSLTKPNPPENSKICIDGYASAYAKFTCERMNAACSQNVNCVNRYLYVQDGDMCVQKGRNMYGRDYNLYNLFYEASFPVYYWKCNTNNKIDINSSFGNDNKECSN